MINPSSIYFSRGIRVFPSSLANKHRIATNSLWNSCLPSKYVLENEHPLARDMKERKNRK